MFSSLFNTLLGLVPLVLSIHSFDSLVPSTVSDLPPCRPQVELSMTRAHERLQRAKQEMHEARCCLGNRDQPGSTGFLVPFWGSVLLG